MLHRRPLPDFIPSLQHCLSKTQFNQANCPLSAKSGNLGLPAAGARGPPNQGGSQPTRVKFQRWRSALGRGNAEGPPDLRGEPGRPASRSGCGRGMPAGKLGNPYSRLPGLRWSGRAAKLVAAAGCRGPRVFETLAASPCRGWSRRALRCSFRPAPGPEVRRRHGPAAASADLSRRSDPFLRTASGQVSGSRPRRASPGRICPLCCATAPGPCGRRDRGLAERRQLCSRPCAVPVLANPGRARPPDCVHRA